MKRRLTCALILLASIGWILITPALVCIGPIGSWAEERFAPRQTHTAWVFRSNGNCSEEVYVEGGFSMQQTLWLIAGVMVPGQVLVVVSCAKFLSQFHVLRTR